MHFNWVTLQVKNMARSLEFYQTVVGLPLMRRYPAGPGLEIAFLGEGATQLELISDSSVQAVSPSSDVSIGFEAGPLEQLIQFLAAKSIPIQSGPFAPNPSIRFLFVQDPDGWLVQFVEHAPAENGSTPNKE